MTKYFILTVSTLFIVFSCQTSDITTIEPARFDFVDFTVLYHFRTVSVHLDSNRNICAWTSKGKDQNEFRKGSLDKKTSEKVDSLLQLILKSQRDTIFGTIPDIGETVYQIIFKTKDKKITVTSNADTCCKDISYLIFLVDKQVENFKTPFTDTNFVFPSRDIIPKEIKMTPFKFDNNP